MDVSPFSAETIAATTAKLGPALLKLLSQCSAPGRSPKSLSLLEFLNLLFIRVQKENLRELASAQIAELAYRSLASLKHYVDSKQSMYVESKNENGLATIQLAVKDKPFVVSSTAETLSSNDVHVQLYLHPIIVINHQSIALSCILLSDINAEELPTVEERLRDTLISLDSVVNDFELMTTGANELTRNIQQGSAKSEAGEVTWKELSELLTLFLEGSFLFLATNWFSDVKKIDVEASSGHGLWRNVEKLPHRFKEEVKEDLNDLIKSKLDFSLRKLRVSSPIHRRVPLIHLLIKTDQPKKPYFSLVGYLTSKALAREADDIPVLKAKLGSILKRESVVPNSYDFKYVSDVVDNIPADEALILSEEQLQAIVHIAIGVFDQEAIRTLSYLDSPQRTVTTVVILPTERESAELTSTFQRLVEEAIGAEPGTGEVRLDTSKRKQHRLFITVPVPSEGAKKIDIPKLSREIIRATRTWDEELSEELKNDSLLALAENAFAQEYKDAITPKAAAHDIEMLSKLSPSTTSLIEIAPTGPKSLFCLTLATLSAPPSISNLAPLLLNFGFETLGANTYNVQLDPSTKAHILKIDVATSSDVELDLDIFPKSVGPGIIAAIKGEIANDHLNMLSLKLALTPREVGVLRAYCQLLWQITRFAAKTTIIKALATTPEAALSIWRAFNIRFDPALSHKIEKRKELFEKEEENFIDFLRNVEDITNDKILKFIWSLSKHTVRTNYFQNRQDIVFKLRTELIEFAPEPRPLFELFVSSPTVEGTHLRSSKVARGGIRWSERTEDYRTEVLGLMKTQTIKNVIIVPSGAKGGFIVKNLPSERNQIPAAVSKTYKEYITALLSVADNRVGNKVVHPNECIVYDDEDPYFVVAADKGTAAFSDIANGIAVEQYNFWLKDAFASGGSKGYDHKKYGITANGAWECVKRHFKDLGIDYEHSPFTVIGIGDMSGDVFGNGMLVSKKMKVLAAFNHQHIFVDPTPNPESSFAERERLFKLPRSQWTDYNKSLISKGGGIFTRADKEISITHEMKNAFAIPDTVNSTVNGETLISLILKAPVELLWNGGIGTYVKASYESNSAVNDSTNDGVRVDATELRARVVAEGGNLGLTQQARVEFSSRGGRVNTDAIDNSGGVDLSDHEVNLKLLLNPLVDKKELSQEERDKLLLQMSNEVCDAVLSHNRGQALLLSAASIWSKENLDVYQNLIRDMHRAGFLNRILDGLPDDQELSERLQQNIGLYRPELSICSAAVKTWIKKDLIASPLLEDPALEPFLLSYFPTLIRDRFKKAISTHPLHREIVASEIVNETLPSVGIAFVHLIHSIFGISPSGVIKNTLAGSIILGLKDVKDEFMRFDTASQNETFMQLWLETGSALGRATSWLIGAHGDELSLTETCNLYREGFATLIKHVDQVFSGREAERFNRRVSTYTDLGLSDKTAKCLATYRRILPILEVLWTQHEFKLSDVRLVASVFSHVLEELGINTVLKYEGVLDPDNKWEQDLIVNSFKDIRRSISLITGRLVTEGVKDTQSVHLALQKMRGFERVRATALEILELEKLKKPFRIAALPVVSRELREMFEITKF